MGTVINFPAKQCHATDVNFYGLELFVEWCGELLNTLPTETRSAAIQEFHRLVGTLVQFMDECKEGCRNE